MRRRTAVAVGILAVMAATARAEDPAPGAVRYGAYTWARVAIGRPDPALKVGGGISVTGPIAVRDGKAWGEIGARFDVDAVPEGEEFSIENIASWGNVAEFTLYAGKRIATLNAGDQEITTSVIVQGRFATSFRETVDAAPRRRFYRSPAVGVRLAEERKGLWISILYGRDEVIGPRGWGQLMVEGSVPIKGPLRFYGRAGLGFGPASISGEQADYLTVGLGLDLLDLLG